MKWVILILLMTSFASAVYIDFDCPDDILADEEFECSLEVFDGEGEYDVKIDLDGERNSVLEVWNDGTWKSGYFYLKEFIESGKEDDIKLRVSEEGNYDGSLKLRQGDKREFFDIEIDVEEAEETKEDEEVVEDEVDSPEPPVEKKSSEPKIISLNEDTLEEVDELVYASKDAKVVSWLPYGFSLFLILIIGILLWERF